MECCELRALELEESTSPVLLESDVSHKISFIKVCSGNPPDNRRLAETKSPPSF
jgi:hypothetical protein